MNLRPRAFSLALLALSSHALPACGGGTACTLIGCNDQVEVTINDNGSALTTGFHGTVTVNGTAFPVACGASGSGGAMVRCPVGGSQLIVTGSTADSIHVTIIADTSGHSIDADVPVTNTTSQPNGPNCDPICRQGRATATLM